VASVAVACRSRDGVGAGRSCDGVAAASRPSRSWAVSQRIPEVPAVLEAADLPVGRSGSAWRASSSRVSRDGVGAGRSCDGVAAWRPGRAGAGQFRRSPRFPPSSKRPTSRSAGPRARGEHRRRVSVPRRCRGGPVPRWRSSVASRPSRSTAASQRIPEVPAVLEAADLPVGRKRVASVVVRVGPAMVLHRGVPAEQELGRFAEERFPPSSKRPTSRSAEREHVARVVVRAGPAKALPRGVPAEQELGRFAEARFPPSSKRPTSRSAGSAWRAATVSGRAGPAMALPRGVPAEQELGRFEEASVVTERPRAARTRGCKVSP
jgi:hypothetical protein